jgi:anti-anti-sigma factor
VARVPPTWHHLGLGRRVPAQEAAMKLSVTREGDLIRVDLDGRLDVEGTREVDDAFAFNTTTAPSRIVVNLAQVSFIASIGIRALLTAARGQRQRGGKLVLAEPQPMVRKVLETAGVDQVVPVYESVNSARTALSV